MRILDKYIIEELFAPFAFGVGAFSSIFIGTSTLFKITQYITKYGASINSVIKLLIYNLPSIVVTTFPMSMLLASLLTFGRLSDSGEITAIRSSGISIFRLAIPVFIAAFWISIFTIFLNEMVVPAANTAYRNVIVHEIEKDAQLHSQKNLVIPEENGELIERLIYARKFDEDSNTMYAITIQDFNSDEQLVRVENAEKAIWEKNKWVMYNGIIHDLTTEGNFERIMYFNQQVMPIKKNPAIIASEQKKPEEMSIKELKQHIRIMQLQYSNTSEYSEYEMELHKKFSIPMASFIFALIGVPLGLQPHRSSSSIGMGISLIIIFIYYTIMAISSALGQSGTIPTLLAAWIPNIIGIVVGFFLIRKHSL